MNINERFSRLDRFISEGRIVRKEWGDGQERACLLLALAPEVGAEGDIRRCPAGLLPAWLAHLTPALDDSVSADAWPEIVREYARVVRRGAETLDDAGWRRVEARFLLAVLAEAASPEGETVAALWRRVLAGDEPRGEEWSAAAAVRAAEAARAAAAAAAAAAWAAARAAGAAAAARAAAEEAARARGALRAAAWDRMTTALLDAIEVECGAPGQERGR